MEKNWLIRTKSNHVLGPISKEKVIELYKNGSINSEDEVCSGNGFWFYIRETEMVNKYLIGESSQGFNPISEARDILPSIPNGILNVVNDDITRVGAINLSILKEPALSSENEDLTNPHLVNPKILNIGVIESKKKNKRPIVSKKLTRRSPVPLKKQNYLKYLGVLGFVLIILLVYFRKYIMRNIFEGESFTSSISFISSASAQENAAAEQRIIDRAITLEKISFKPVIGLEGFKVVSTFDIEQISCSDLNNEVNQMGIILYSPEVINENFLIKIRDCVLKLDEHHPLKRWIKWVAQSHSVDTLNQEKHAFLIEIINSPYNLITDLKMRNRIIEILSEIPELTIPEKILKSYLYLMIGNLTRSDNILKKIIANPPIANWKKQIGQTDFFHKLSLEYSHKILPKISNHPTDRRSLELFSLYILNFFNDKSLIEIVEKFDTSGISDKLGLKYITSLAPDFVNYLKLKDMSDDFRIKKLRMEKVYPVKMQSYWIWAFMNIDPLISEFMNPQLQELEKEDEIWFIYLLGNEKISDLYYSKKGKSFLPGRREYLKKNLQEHDTFMLSLYKLIELGDIHPELVMKTTDYLLNK